MHKKHVATIYAILAAALYAVNIPLSKLLLGAVAPTMMAAFLYLGAGLGMLAWNLFHPQPQREALTRKELPYTIAMVVLDIFAPIALMLGIARTNSANVSLLNNFEIVATSLIALVIFKEVISRRLWTAIFLVTAASFLLTFESSEGFTFNLGSVLVLGACVCWGFENNATRMLSNCSSQQIVIIKGCFSGLGSLMIALLLGEPLPKLSYILVVLLLGFVSYGLSINVYILAQKELGAAKTSAYYSLAPFLGVAFSMAVLGERPGIRFYAALFIMVLSTLILVKDTISLQHTHEHSHIHTHPHRHGTLVHSHEHEHIHSHSHIHGEDSESHSHEHADIPEHKHTHTKE